MHAAIRDLARRRPGQKSSCAAPRRRAARWDGLFAEFPNVSVIREGSHVPWTLASRLLCTRHAPPDSKRMSRARPR